MFERFHLAHAHVAQIGRSCFERLRTWPPQAAAFASGYRLGVFP